MHTRFNRQLPLQEPISSASQMPSSSTQAISSQIASLRYVEQFRALLDHQRQVFDKERALWHIERSELHGKILELEAVARRFQARSNSESWSPLQSSGSKAATLTSFSVGDQSREANSSADDGPWKPSQSQSVSPPSRTFSGFSIASVAGVKRHMPSISENESSDVLDNPLDAELKKREPGHRPSIEGSKIDKNLDGINFKPGGLAPSLVKSVMTPPSTSPLHSPPFARGYPSTLELPPKTLVPEDPYTKDAGHTPLAPPLKTLGSHSSSGDSEIATVPEQERPPLEPHTSVIRPPNERANSYFPLLPDSADEDPALQGPLGLVHDETEDKIFLRELDLKLSQVQSESSAPDEHDVKPGEEAKLDLRGGGEADPEPKLRIKRSMNFGSQLGGASSCGRGI
ncbi:hypothetical protein MMC20_003406 [Loxospora ochrophaea]|nr:hypothetical protein [Loxospora ochrophaea]